MKRKFVFILMFIICAVPAIVLSDSPATSTEFYTAYTDIEMVDIARRGGKVTLEIAYFLSAPDNPIDVKVAVVNALGWDIDGKKNAEIFLKYISDFRGKKPGAVQLQNLSADQLLCLGYLTLLDDYFHADKAIPILEMAVVKNKTSFTFAMILSLAKSQKAMDNDWCAVWKNFDDVINNPKLDRDMRQEAIQIVFEYMSMYRGDCKSKMD